MSRTDLTASLTEPYKYIFRKFIFLLTVVHMIHIFVNNFFCVACLIFALTIFKGNDLLHILIVKTIL
jgi:hypothetical protein